MKAATASTLSVRLGRVDNSSPGRPIYNTATDSVHSHYDARECCKGRTGLCITTIVTSGLRRRRSTGTGHRNGSPCRVSAVVLTS
jgi:hypothetical protein